MPKYISSGKPIGICDRCKFKFELRKLKPDRNAPGLRVCDDCNDLKDPYQLPPPKPEKISLAYPRPDEPLVCPPPPEEEE